MRGEECRREEGVDRDLGRAAHVRREENGHLAVTVGRDGACCHDGGHRAAKADEHRHDAAPGKPDAAQGLVHNERHARHVAGIL